MSEGNASLLVLEDNDEGFEFLNVACRQYGRPVRVSGFQRAEPLLEQTENQPVASPALAMLDLRLPGESGLAVFERLKKTLSYVSVPAVVLTTGSNPADNAQCDQAWANAFQAIVVEMETMMRSLVSVLTCWVSDVVHCPVTGGSRHE